MKARAFSVLLLFGRQLVTHNDVNYVCVVKKRDVTFPGENIVDSAGLRRVVSYSSRRQSRHFISLWGGVLV